MNVGTLVRVRHGMFEGLEAPIIGIIESKHTDVRYDVEGTYGRWYYEYELEVIVEGSKEGESSDQTTSTAS